MIVIFTPERQIPARKGIVILEQVVIHPGRNFIEPNSYQKIAGLPEYKELLELEAIIEIKEEAKPIESISDLKDLDGFSPDDAVTLINTLDDLVLLKNLKEAEGKLKRRAVLHALTQRIKELESGI